MHTVVLAFLGLALAADSDGLPKDVFEIHDRQFAMPLYTSADFRGRIERIRLYVSDDLGKTWTHAQDCKPGDEQATFSAPRDGEYWFALQVKFKDGKSEPADLATLTPGMKVRVKTGQKSDPRAAAREIARYTAQLMHDLYGATYQAAVFYSKVPAGLREKGPPIDVWLYNSGRAIAAWWKVAYWRYEEFDGRGHWRTAGVFRSAY
jgi:hypothetical protein